MYYIAQFNFFFYFDYYFSLYLKLFYRVSTRHYIKSSQLFNFTPVTVPTLAFYSKDDPVGGEEANLPVLQNFRDRGIPVSHVVGKKGYIGQQEFRLKIWWQKSNKWRLTAFCHCRGILTDLILKFGL